MRAWNEQKAYEAQVRRDWLQGYADQGVTAGRAAVMAGIDRGSLLRMARQCGVSFSVAGVLTVEACRACAAEGLTRRDAARRLQVSCNYLSEFAARNGVEFLSARRGVSAYRECARDGLTVCEAAQRLGVSEAWVRKQARQHGLQFAQEKARSNAKPKVVAKPKAAGCPRAVTKPKALARLKVPDGGGAKPVAPLSIIEQMQAQAERENAAAQRRWGR